jgi:transposase
MFQVEIYGRVRRAVRVEGRSQRAVARDFGLSRETVRKMLQYAVPPGYQRQQPLKRPKLGPWLGVIAAILDDDKQRPAKQRHTAKRIFERLREEHGFSGGCPTDGSSIRRRDSPSCKTTPLRLRKTCGSHSAH